MSLSCSLLHCCFSALFIFWFLRVALAVFTSKVPDVALLEMFDVCLIEFVPPHLFLALAALIVARIFQRVAFIPTLITKQLQWNASVLAGDASFFALFFKSYDRLLRLASAAHELFLAVHAAKVLV